MIRSIARAIAGSVSTPITGSGPSEPQAPIIASVTISGGTLVGDVLSSSISYTQEPVPSATPSYQWDRDGSPISGATSASYTLVEADAGAAITLDVSVTNSEGSDSATSNTINAAALPLDGVTSAVLAFSVARKLRSDYAGSAIRVRRSSDDAEQDIGFTAGNVLDESALTTFVGANDGFVVTVYDQSTSGNDATQSTAAEQPQIVNSGSIIKRNGKPFFRVPDTSGVLVTASNTGITGSAERTLYVVGYRNKSADTDVLASFGVITTGSYWYHTAEYAVRVVGGVRVFATSPPASVELSASVLPSGITNVSGATMYVNSVLQTETAVAGRQINTGASPLYIGRASAGVNNADADISEVILLDSGGSTDRGALDASASIFFGVSI